MAPALASHIFSAALLVAGSAILLSCVYLLTLAVASFLHRHAERPSAQRSRIVVLVPAHDEEELIARCLESLDAQTYPRRLRRAVVIADNCSDRTADVARSHGARVLVRNDAEAPGKGRALRWAIDRLLAKQSPPDVFVIVDADSVVEPQLLEHLEADLAAGAEVAQADYRVLHADDDHPRTRLVGLGFLLFHRTRLSGRAALGLPANLVGNGMAFRRHVFEHVPWSAFTAVEDLEYSLTLRLAGVRPVFTPRAVVHGPVPSSKTAMRSQRMRWEGGRLYLLTRWLPPLLWGAIRKRDWGLLDAALDLAVLPLGLLVLIVVFGSVIGGFAVAGGIVSAPSVAPWALSLVLLPAYVVIGLRAADAPPSAYRTLASTPGFLAAKLLVYCRLLFGFDPGRWEDAGRATHSRDLLDPDGDGKAWIGGVPVDVVDMDGAVNRVMSMVGRPDGGHVCTVNLDFVVTAQKNSEVNGVLRSSDLNVADGAPVTWLARMLGHRVPRVAGADLVPLIAGAAAERGIPVFFLGGEGSAAEESARRLSDAFPTLRVAGCYEPPLGTIDDLPSAEMVRLIRESGADIVLVGLGHPKQEQWIAQNRTALGSSVSIGVGGCFDFITARRRRAPRWVQDCGLEWTYRLAQEPRRLLKRYARDAGWMLVLTARTLSSRKGLHSRA